MATATLKQATAMEMIIIQVPPMMVTNMEITMTIVLLPDKTAMVVKVQRAALMTPITAMAPERNTTVTTGMEEMLSPEAEEVLKGLRTAVMLSSL